MAGFLVPLPLGYSEKVRGMVDTLPANTRKQLLVVVYHANIGVRHGAQRSQFQGHQEKRDEQGGTQKRNRATLHKHTNSAPARHQWRTMRQGNLQANKRGG